jgi:hypothetical protein
VLDSARHPESTGCNSPHLHRLKVFSTTPLDIYNWQSIIQLDDEPRRTAFRLAEASQKCGVLVLFLYIFPALRAGINLFAREQISSVAEPRPASPKTASRGGSGEAERLTNLVWRDILKLARTYFEQNP